MKPEKIKIALVDDDKLIVQLLDEYLSQREQFEIVITAINGESFIQKLHDSDILPDVVLLDLRMQGMSGLETLAALKSDFPGIRAIVVSSHYQKIFMGHMMKSGACAFLPKGVSPEQLVVAISEVSEKGFYFMKEQIEILREQVASNAPAFVPDDEISLSPREIDVLKLICQQQTSKQIADQLFISQRTVEGHKANLLLKTGAKNTAGLVVYAIKNKIVDLSDCVHLSF